MPRLGEYLRWIQESTEYGRVIGMYLNAEDDVFVQVQNTSTYEVEDYHINSFNELFKVL